MTDWPGCAFAKELIEAYPEAKVILTTRDVDSWHRSVSKTVLWRAQDPELKAIAKLDWGAGLYAPMLGQFWRYFFYDDFENKGKQRYLDHYDEVRSLVPPERLLEYNVSSGWEPLCEFLEEPIPKTTFPRSNDANNFVQRCRTQNKRQIANVLFRALVVGVPVLTAALSAGFAYTHYLPNLSKVALPSSLLMGSIGTSS